MVAVADAVMATVAATIVVTLVSSVAQRPVVRVEHPDSVQRVAQSLVGLLIEPTWCALSGSVWWIGEGEGHMGMMEVWWVAHTYTSF